MMPAVLRLKDLCSYLSLTHFWVSPRRWWGTFAGLAESHAWLQQTMSCRMQMGRLAELTCAGSLRAFSLDTNRESLAFPVRTVGFAAPLPPPFSPVSNFLTVLSGFDSPLSLSSLLPQRAWSCSLAVAIEITPLSLPLLFSSALWQSRLHHPKCARPALLPATWAGCRAEWWAEYPYPDGCLSHYSVLQTRWKLHWLVPCSEG